MSIWNAILLGLVQGIAEFLPISSSGHLSILQNLFKMQDAAIDLLTEGECNISVRTLIEKAAVERSTFYAYYERLDDVLEAAENTVAEDLINAGSNSSGINEYLESLFSAFSENRRRIKALLTNANRYSLIEKMLNAVRYSLAESLTKEYSQENAMLDDILSGAMINPLLSYVMEGRDLNLSMLEERLVALIACPSREESSQE